MGLPGAIVGGAVVVLAGWLFQRTRFDLELIRQIREAPVVTMSELRAWVRARQRVVRRRRRVPPPPSGSALAAGASSAVNPAAGAAAAAVPAPAGPGADSAAPASGTTGAPVSLPDGTSTASSTGRAGVATVPPIAAAGVDTSSAGSAAVDAEDPGSDDDVQGVYVCTEGVVKCDKPIFCTIGQGKAAVRQLASYRWVEEADDFGVWHDRRELKEIEPREMSEFYLVSPLDAEQTPADAERLYIAATNDTELPLRRFYQKVRKVGTNDFTRREAGIIKEESVLPVQLAVRATGEAVLRGGRLTLRAGDWTHPLVLRERHDSDARAALDERTRRVMQRRSLSIAAAFAGVSLLLLEASGRTNAAERLWTYVQQAFERQ